METRHLHRLLQGAAECDSAVESLILILEAAVELVSIPGNDFCWSYWADEFEAKAELQALIHSLKAGTLPERLNVAVLFAPTGPLQELGMSSGWAETYLKVAGKFDEVETLLW
ncbi:hypothetical protein KJF94_14760 [Pseudomonas hormoni]|uniref:Uncharacterized protein n=1 Tax=Pseudomonas hormoni TaxID=3093767 RepID=A0ABX8F480_9PSED|nr:hypothetical protein [Pseudomonas hormoni]QVW26714.1 hypothetical protein KJF94_14760 [Pseudomonas hormoni]